jgi:hypothetical protein
MTFKEMEAALQSLNDAEKIQLLKRLIEELDSDSDEEIEQLWLVEAQKRLKELKEGLVQPVPASEVIAIARDRLKHVRGIPS